MSDMISSGSPTEPMRWHPGLEWEVTGRGTTGYRAELYRAHKLLATLRGRNRAWLAIRMRWIRRRHERQEIPL